MENLLNPPPTLFFSIHKDTHTHTHSSTPQIPTPNDAKPLLQLLRTKTQQRRSHARPFFSSSCLIPAHTTRRRLPCRLTRGACAVCVVCGPFPHPSLRTKICPHSTADGLSSTPRSDHPPMRVFPCQVHDYHTRIPHFTKIQFLTRLPCPPALLRVHPKSRRPRRRRHPPRDRPPHLPQAPSLPPHHRRPCRLHCRRAPPGR